MGTVISKGPRIVALDSKSFDKLPYKHANSSFGVSDKNNNVGFVRMTDNPQENYDTFQHEMNHLLNDEPGIYYKNIFSKIGDWVQDKVFDPVVEFIDPILPESVKDNPLQSILAIGAAIPTGGASLAALAPFAIESGLGQLGLDLPNWIPGVASGLMLPGTGATLPGFGPNGAFANLPGVSTLQKIPGIGGYFGSGPTFGYTDPVTGIVTRYGAQGALPITGGDLFQNVLSGFKGGVSNIFNTGSGLVNAIKSPLSGIANIFGSGGGSGGTGGGGGTGGLNIGNLLGGLFRGGGGTSGRYGGGDFVSTIRYPVAQPPQLIDIYNDPNAFYSRFQPTSFDEALANQYFANTWPDKEREILHGLSLAGIESSPITAKLLGEARGKLGVEIGQYLSNLGQQRASQALEQSNLQKGVNFRQALQQAESDYAGDVAREREKAAKIGTITGVGGSLIGSILGNPQLGSNIGGLVGGLMGGTGWPTGDIVETIDELLGSLFNRQKQQPLQTQPVNLPSKPLTGVMNSNDMLMFYDNLLNQIG